MGIQDEVERTLVEVEVESDGPRPVGVGIYASAISAVADAPHEMLEDLRGGLMSVSDPFLLAQEMEDTGEMIDHLDETITVGDRRTNGPESRLGVETPRYLVRRVDPQPHRSHLRCDEVLEHRGEQAARDEAIAEQGVHHVMVAEELAGPCGESVRALKQHDGADHTPAVLGHAGVAQATLR